MNSVKTKKNRLKQNLTKFFLLFLMNNSSNLFRMRDVRQHRNYFFSFVFTAKISVLLFPIIFLTLRVLSPDHSFYCIGFVSRLPCTLWFFTELISCLTWICTLLANERKTFCAIQSEAVVYSYLNTKLRRILVIQKISFPQPYLFWQVRLRQNRSGSKRQIE